MAEPLSKKVFSYEESLIDDTINQFDYIGGTINTWIGLSFLDSQHLMFAMIKCVFFIKAQLVTR